MVPRRVLRPLLVALVSLLAIAPSAGRPLPALAASVTFTVTSPADRHDARPGDGVCADGARQCTLRAAVEEANAQPAGSVVAITIPAGTYPLSLGTLVLTRNTITLVGTRGHAAILDGRGNRVLAVDASAFATISGLTLRDGDAGSADGGGLANFGGTIVSRSAIVSDTALSGGGLYNAAGARLWVLDSSVVHNRAPTGSGGGIANDGLLAVSGSLLSQNTAQMGGAIVSTGTLLLTSSSVTTNTSTISTSNAGGGGLYSSGPATVVSSTLSGNIAVGAPGAGIYSRGTLTVTDSMFDANATRSDGSGIANQGTLVVANSTFSSNSTSISGGGIYNYYPGTMTVTNSIFNANVTSQDSGVGGIDNYFGSTALVVNSTFNRNVGAGIGNNGTLTLAASTLNGNSIIGNGGGIYNAGAMTVTNSTLSGNTARVTISEGGGIYNEGTLTVTNSTLSGNAAYNGGALYNHWC